MQLSAVNSVIAARLGQRSGLEAQILNELKLAQTILEVKEPLPWFLIKEAEITSVQGNKVGYYDLLHPPADFIKEFEDCGLWLQAEGREKLLTKDDFAVLNSSGYLSEETTEVSTYALVGGSFYLRPRPQEAKTIRLFYYAKDEELSGDPTQENKWLKEIPLILVGQAGMNIARFLRDPDAINLFDADRKEANDFLMRLNTSRIEAARSAVLGG